MKNSLSVLVIGLFAVMANLELQAQKNSASNPPSNHGSQITSRELAESRKPSIIEIKGNPFLFKDWNTKGIVYSQGYLLQGDSLNYHVYADKIVTKEKDSFYVFNVQLIDSVKINDKRLHKLNGELYEVLQKGSKASLYKKYKAKIVRGKKNIHGTQEASKLEITEHYYILSLKKLKKFNPSERRLENVFEDQAHEMKKIIKAGNLDYNKEDDLIRIFESFNGL